MKRGAKTMTERMFAAMRLPANDEGARCAPTGTEPSRRLVAAGSELPDSPSNTSAAALRYFARRLNEFA